MGEIPILSGRRCSLWWVADASEHFRAKEYFDNLNVSERAKFQALFELMAENGVILNKERFRKEHATHISCFKSGQHRLACFREGRSLMLVHGFRKKTDKDKRLKRGLEAAERIRTEHLKRNAKD